MYSQGLELNSLQMILCRKHNQPNSCCISISSLDQIDQFENYLHWIRICKLCNFPNYSYISWKGRYIPCQQTV